MTFTRKIKRRLLPLGLSIAVIVPLCGCSVKSRLNPGLVWETAPLADQIRVARHASQRNNDKLTLHEDASDEHVSGEHVAPVTYDMPVERHPAAIQEYDFPSTDNSRVTRRIPLAVSNQREVSPSFRNTASILAEPPSEVQVQDVPALTMSQSIENAAPIDLANALGIAGANNLDIQFARERVVEAHASFDKARVAWLPTLRLGIGFSKHDGRIQSTAGEVIDTDRNSLFVGGGAGLAQAPLTAGAGGPARLFVNLSLADTIFNRMIAENEFGYSAENENVVTKQTLLNVSLAYFDLVEAYGRLANADVGLDSSRKLLELTENFEAEGAGSKAEVDRARTVFLDMQQRRTETLRIVNEKSERLKRLIRFGHEQPLAPADIVVLPLEIYPASPDINVLVEQGMSVRNEIHRQQYAVAANYKEYRRETIRPLLPSLQVGVSGGMFGGGESTDLDNVGGRSDLEVVAVWEAENMGLGNRIKRRETASRYRQAQHRAEMMRDQVREEISVAVNNVESYRRQLAYASDAMRSAQASYDRNADRIQDGEGLPIEMLQAIRAQVDSLDAYTRAVTRFNQAQFELIRAVGSVPADPKMIVQESVTTSDEEEASLKSTD